MTDKHHREDVSPARREVEQTQQNGQTAAIHTSRDQQGQADGAYAEALGRAESMVDYLGHQAGHYVGLAGLQLLRWGARFREEVEDIWAEAQSLREQKHSDEQRQEPT